MNEKIKFCDKIQHNWHLENTIFKNYVKKTLFEKFCLLFVKKQVEINTILNLGITYKVLFGKVFVLETFIVLAGINCICTFSKNQ